MDPPGQFCGSLGIAVKTKLGSTPLPNVFNDLAGQARGFCSQFHGNSQGANFVTTQPVLIEGRAGEITSGSIANRQI
jgi:hypothetical protein